MDAAITTLLATWEHRAEQIRKRAAAMPQSTTGDRLIIMLMQREAEAIANCRRQLAATYLVASGSTI